MPGRFASPAAGRDRRGALAGWPAAALLAVGAVAAQTAAPPQLYLPVQCRPGTDCWIQNYVDNDPTAGARDYRCGTRSYDRHDGTDIRLRDLAAMHAGVAVLAGAAGRVAAVRDGMPDVSVRAAEAAAVDGRECGNGVRIEHPGGWSTQYCHMARGSIAVRPGQSVAAGQPLGRIGLSGQTEYPHLHFTVRLGTQTVDPFAQGAPSGSCAGGQSLWAPAAAALLAYEARSVLATGFSAGAPEPQALAAGPLPAPAADSPALVAHAAAIGLQGGDVQRLLVRAPDGSVFADNQAEPLPRPQAQSFLFAGRRRPAAGFAAGRYSAVYEVRREGAVVLRREFVLELAR